MGYFWDSLVQAVKLLIAFDPEVIEVLLLSLKIAGVSTLLASIIGAPLGFILATKEFVGRKTITSILNTLLGMPTVVAGLIAYGLLSRRGIFGALGLLFTWKAIVVGQFIVVMPVIAALVLNAVRELDASYRLTALSLGASRWQAAALVLLESRYAIIGAIIAGFGRVVGEVGASMMLGGNIRGATRTLTTAISLETSKGEFAFALALGLILMLVFFVINSSVNYLRER
ncbi:MAG: ABC transporter permease [Firmicutes bacterium]|nr:ABC transporter permease [Bacillota bacterium]